MIPVLAGKGTTVIISTHVIAHADRLCDEVSIISGGRVPLALRDDGARRAGSDALDSRGSRPLTGALGRHSGMPESKVVPQPGNEIRSGQNEEGA